MDSIGLQKHGLIGVNPCDIIDVKLYLSPKLHTSNEQDFVDVKVDKSKSVKYFKQVLATLWNYPDLDNFHLVWGGSVIPSKAIICESGLELYQVACLIAPCSQGTANWELDLSVFQNLQYDYEPRSDQNDIMSEEPSPSAVLKAFTEDLSGTVAPWKPVQSDIDLLKWVYEALSNEDSPKTGMPAVQWYPKYGCALVARLTPFEQVRLSLVSLDNWSFYMHSAPASRVHNSVPDDRNVTVLFVGSVDSESYKSFLDSFQRRFQKVVQRRTGSERSSASGSQGHHKTPGMVQAVMLDILEGKDEHERTDEDAVLPKGGFTDVGLHTGGRARNTRWPLFVAVLHHLLDSKQANNLFHRVMFQLPLRLAERSTFCLTKTTSSDSNQDELSKSIGTDTNSVMQTLRHVAQKAESCAQLDSFKGEFVLSEARCIRIRHELDEAVMSHAKYISDRYELARPLRKNIQYKHLTVLLPAELPPSADAEEKKSVNDVARENTTFTPIPLPVDCVWEEMARWTNDFMPKCSGNYVMRMILCNAIEDFFFRKMMNVENVAPNTVEKVMDMYRKVARHLQTCSESKAMLRGELLSKEVLVVWIAFCHVHHSVKKSHPLVREYSVALQPDDLKFLVLSKKESVDAAREVIKYLRENSKGHGPIFSGHSDEDMTLNLALRFGNACTEITETWDLERQAMSGRESDRWKVIQRKKQKLKELDEILRHLETELLKVSQQRQTLHEQWESYRYLRRKDKALEDKEIEEDCLSRRVDEMKSRIKLEERAPSPIFQPCPSQRNLAIPVIFFLTMPDDLSIFSRLSFLSKQLLLPKENNINVPTVPRCENLISVDKVVASSPPKTIWRDYHDNGSTTRTFESTARVEGVIIGSSSSIVSGKWYSQNVRNISSSSDGVWYPDGLRPSLFWNGGGCNLDSRSNEMHFNPFLNTLSHISMYTFTENLGKMMNNPAGSPLQWAMFQIGAETSPKRGNYALAFQNDMRAEIANKNALLDFCGIRAYPHQQIRRLCSGLKSRRMALSDEKVQMLLQQALYQLGSVSEDEAVEREWYTDSNRFDGWTSLREILNDLCEELRSKSREHDSISILGELAAHVSQFDPGCREVARKFASIAEKAANDLSRDEITSSHKNAPIIRARRCILYMSCLLCHSAGELSLDDVRQICRSLVMAEYTRLFEDPTYLDEKIRKQTAMTMNIVAARMLKIYTVVKNNQHVLNEVVKAVHEAAADVTTWSRWHRGDKHDLALFSGESADGLSYHINLQTGELLIDGRPPSRLPLSILSSPLYRRSFGDRNFEIVRDQEGRCKTARSIGGCFYEFKESGTRLLIRELHSSRANSILELLDARNINSWGEGIPSRLQKMYSHWLCRRTNTIFFRSKYFCDRDVHFVMTCEAGWKCFKIPSHLRAKDWLHAERDFSGLSILVHLVDESSVQVLNVLMKFENVAEGIHCYKTAKDTFLIDLPRYGLEFELTEEGILKSNSFSSFSLRGSQNFDDTLMLFSGYLILESQGMRKVLIPAGQVQKEKGIVSIKGSDSVEARRRFHIYTVHSRFGTIQSVGGKLSIEGRLQLAALYAATSTALPEKRIGQTGSEHAIELLRQSWKNAPMSPSEKQHLESICAFGQLCPALNLLACEIFSSSRILDFLPFSSSTRGEMLMNSEASTDYVLQKNRNQLNPRTLLTDDEERFLHGEVLATTIIRIKPNIETPSCTSAVPTMNDIKRVLEGMLCVQQGVTKGMDFPLDSDSFGETGIGAMIRNGLRESWTAYKQLSDLSLSSDNYDALRNQIQACLNSCSDSLAQLQSAIHLKLRSVYGPHTPNACFNIRRAANMEALSTTGDFLKIHCAIMGIDFLNPFLSSGSCEVVRSVISEWMQLSVMEDKLSRMLQEIERHNAAELTRELRELERNWDPREHPSWLAFEVEQQLQIRDLQYRVVEFCLRNPGKITQLNMGEGKTRVILPMLILDSSERNLLMRIHILSPLLSEAHDFLHHTITASILNRRFFRIPFHRDVKLTPSKAEKIMNCLIRCRDNGGALVIAPEHRLSLILKGTELELQNSKRHSRESLQGIYDMNYFDLFDESDEILHHRYQLIYAVGSCIPLSAGKERWIAAQAVLRQLQCDLSVAKELEALAIRESRSGGSECSLDSIRLHSDLPNQKLQVLMGKLALAICRDPPYLMRWLKRSTFLETIVSFVAEPHRSVDWFYQEVGKENVTETQMSYLLALRGILAFGLLHHCLTLRYRVDYGIDPRRENRRVAVPYRGSDRPSERAEYAHPDTLILFTHLAYYYRGLSKEECTEAVTALLKLGSIAQKEEYKQWLHGVKSLNAGKRRLIDDADKLDATNAAQMTLLHKVYQYNMAAISFWLDACVLPRETMQFPQRISANAFHLAESKTRSITGFSGTKDNSILLPTQVTQEQADMQEVKATDGKMIALILQNRQVRRLSTSVKLFEAVLRECIQLGTSALIDGGALMAGLENDEVARRMISLLEENRNDEIQGVVFFDKTEASWVVLSPEGRQWPLGSSPIHERDAFVYFDESHCRGADMKLRNNASALLTIGPDMCKDKLMQAAGRMRKLDRGQRLVFGVPEEIARKFGSDKETLTSKKLLKWILGNTVKAIAKGLVAWGMQGAAYCSTQDVRTKLVAEVLELETLYGSPVTEGLISDTVNQGLLSELRRIANLNVPMATVGREVMLQISARATEYGSDQTVVQSSADEECEREIEHERQLEREWVVLPPRKAPAGQVGWDFDKLLSARLSGREVVALTGGEQLSAAARGALKSVGISAIAWGLCDIYLTRNFLDCVREEDGGATEMGAAYLRPVDAMAFFDGGRRCLLLSEWELDELLPRVWARCRAHGARALEVGIANFGLVFPAEGGAMKSVLTIPEGLAGRIGQKASARTLAGLQLFAGQTMFPGPRKSALRELVSSDKAKRAALKLVRLRGGGHLIARSDLDDVCET